jgi:hypothetical protein
MQVKTTIASVVAALAIAATPAFADKPVGTPGAAKPQAHATGKASAPGQLCKGQSRKKTNHGKGKSPFAACVIGVKRAEADAEHARQTGEDRKAPGRLCRDMSHKKGPADAKSPFAACVTGAAKSQHAG